VPPPPAVEVPPAPVVEVPPPPAVVDVPPPPAVVEVPVVPPPPVVKRKPARPTVPSGLTGQVAFLRQHCVGRVQCAQSLVQDAANFAKLTGSELRDMKMAVPRCIEKCQRQ
jgi:hypothetical protein